MKMSKKIKCLHCGGEIEENGKCICGIITVANNVVVEGKLGIDYQDISAVLLNE